MNSDDNTVEDILGLISFVNGRESWPDEVDQATVDQIVARIDAKLTRNTNPTRRNWFERSRDHARDAASAFARQDFATFEFSLRKCAEFLRDGNKAHRRKATFVIDTDGSITPKDS